jgi:HEAT repeat protein
MLRNVATIVALAMIGVCLATTPLLADSVKLKNEKTLEGIILFEDGKILILENPDFGFKEVHRSEIAMIVRKSFPEPGKEKGAVVVTLDNRKVYKGTIIESDSDSVTLEIPEVGRKVFRRSEIKEIAARRDKEFPRPNPTVHGKFAILMVQLQSEKPISLKKLKSELVKLEAPVVPSLLRYLDMKPENSAIGTLLDILVKFKDDQTVGYLKFFLDSDSKDIQLAVVHVLGNIGDAEAVKALLPPLLGKDTQLGRAAGKAIKAILQKEPDNHKVIRVLHNAAKSAEASVKVRIINCLAFSRSRLAAAVLLEFLGEWEKTSVKRAVINAIGVLCFADSGICSAIRPFLKHKNKQLRKEAALTLGKLQDLESGKGLISLLKDKDKGVRGNAYWALKKITGLKFPPSYDRWKDWWDKEYKKINDERKALLKQLHSNTPRKMIKAIPKLAGVQLCRKEIASALLEYITYGNSDIQIEVCKALGRMKAREAVPKLVERLSDYDDKVAAAAHKALQAITGKKLPASKVEWQKWLASQGR